VLEEFQGQGLGSALIRRLEQETKSIGRKYLMLKAYGPSQVDLMAQKAMKFLVKNDFSLLAEYDYIWQDHYLCQKWR
jgi:GNAT superfamily N-acetyltransferase